MTGQDVVHHADSVSPERLIDRLKSDRFSVRHQAMIEILRNPRPVIPAIEATIEFADSDFKNRALKILELVAVENEFNSKLAMDSLRNISLSPQRLLADKAGATSFKVLICKQYRSAQHLERLNARITTTRTVDNQTYPLATQLVIGENWRGTRLDLDQIANLFGLSELELNHNQVDDNLIAGLDSIYTLRRIKLKRCSVTNACIAQLAKTGTISQLEILYCPIGPGCFDSLRQFAHLTSLRMIGTDVEPSHSPLLEQRLSASVDIRRGAFLGIRYNPTQPGCQLTSLVPGSAAQHSGLLVGDRIVQVDQLPVAAYEDLTKILRQQRLGDQVTLKVLRAGHEILLDVVMGEWE